MSDTLYESTSWQDYPDTTTPITASELNRMENGIIRVPKETGTFLLQLVGTLKSEEYYLNITPSGTVLRQAYSPANGDKLAVWKSYAVPCVDGTDYTVTEDGGSYVIQAASGTVMQNVRVQVWNFPAATGGGIIGTAYTSVHSLTTESIYGTTEESD